MISGVPLFRGRDNQDQLLHIMRIIGTPDDRVLKKLIADSVWSSTFDVAVTLNTLSARDDDQTTISEIPQNTTRTSSSQGSTAGCVGNAEEVDQS